MSIELFITEDHKMYLKKMYKLSYFIIGNYNCFKKCVSYVCFLALPPFQSDW